VKIPFLSCFVSIWLSGPVIQAEEIVAERYEKEIVVANCADPLQLEVSADGKVFFIERAGAVKCFDPASGLTSKLLQLMTLVDGDAGALALALDPGFARNGWLYVYYTVGEGPQQMRLARYTWQAGALVDEKRLLEIPLEQQTTPYHCGGGLGWDRQGNLLLSTGDNSAPQDVPAIHPTEPKRDSRRSAGNSAPCASSVISTQIDSVDASLSAQPSAAAPDRPINKSAPVLRPVLRPAVRRGLGVSRSDSSVTDTLCKIHEKARPGVNPVGKNCPDRHAPVGQAMHSWVYLTPATLTELTTSTNTGLL
jgi:hypothetical protein